MLSKYYSEKSTFFEQVAHLQFAVQSALIDQSAVQFELENGSEKVVSLAFENILLSVAICSIDFIFQTDQLGMVLANFLQSD